MRTAPCAVDIMSAAVTAPARTAIFMRSPLRVPGASSAGNAPPGPIIENQMWGKCGISAVGLETGPTFLPGGVASSGGRLLELRPRVPDQSGPFRGFSGNEGGEVVWGSDLRLRAEAREV